MRTSSGSAYVDAAAGSEVKKAVSKTATCGTSKAARAASMPAIAPGVVQGRQRDEAADVVDHPVVDEHRVGEVRPPVHDAVADGAQPGPAEVDARLPELVGDHAHRRRVVGDPAAGLADAFHEPLGPHLGGLGHHELVLQRGGPGVEHQDRAAVVRPLVPRALVP